MTNKQTHSVSVDLTKPFILWTVLWAVVGLVTEFNGFVITMMVLPWAFSVVMILFILFVGIIAMANAYNSGQTVVYTNKWTGKTKTYRKGRK